MTGYDTWTIGTETIPHVRTASINTKEHTITLECSALDENIQTGDSDCRDEIARFESLTSQEITNESLLNGGTKLQYSNGQYLEVTDSTNTYTRCCLEPIEIDEDHKSTKRIDYTLILHYELDSPGGSYVYTPSFADYSNIDYYMFSDGTNPGDPGSTIAYGNEFGRMIITESQNVRRVEVHGSGDCGTSGTDCWISINGEKRYWHYTDVGDKKGYAGNNLEIGEEKFTWDLDTPTDVITVQTSDHLYPTDICERNRGCWLRWLRVVFE